VNNQSIRVIYPTGDGRIVLRTEAKHDENAWAARSPIPFQFLFGKLLIFADRGE
jgi:hypothetical protein